MTTLTELRRMAEAAQRSVDDEDDVYQQALDDLSDYLYPSVVLAMLDVIEAAKVMFEAGGVSDEDCAFEAALARLEQEQSK